jgi:hypothetical protein
MIAPLSFFLTLFASPFKSKGRLEAENAALQHQLIVCVQHPWSQPIERSTHQAVNVAEGNSPRGLAPQHIELISKNKNFGLQRSPRPEQGSEYQPIAVAVSRFGFAVGTGDGVTAVGVPLDPIDQACFLNSSTRTRVFSL